MLPKTALDALEAKWATGLTRVDGRHVSEIGLVARDGRRRVFAGDDGDFSHDFYADYLFELSKEALSGSMATIFERRVLDPLVGKPRASIEELAFQFGKTPKRIYKILETAKSRIMNLYIEKVSRAKAPLGESCPTCGRVYGNGWSPCKRGFASPLIGNLKNIPLECLPQVYRSAMIRDWERSKKDRFDQMAQDRKTFGDAVFKKLYPGAWIKYFAREGGKQPFPAT